MQIEPIDLFSHFPTTVYTCCAKPTTRLTFWQRFVEWVFPSRRYAREMSEFHEWWAGLKDDLYDCFAEDDNANRGQGQ